MHQLEDCANQCIAVNDDYFEFVQNFLDFFFGGFQSTVSKLKGRTVYVRLHGCLQNFDYEGFEWLCLVGSIRSFRARISFFWH